MGAQRGAQRVRSPLEFLALLEQPNVIDEKREVRARVGVNLSARQKEREPSVVVKVPDVREVRQGTSASRDRGLAFDLAAFVVEAQPNGLECPVNDALLTLGIEKLQPLYLVELLRQLQRDWGT